MRVNKILLLIRKHTPYRNGLAYSYYRAFKKMNIDTNICEIESNIVYPKLDKLFFNKYFENNIMLIFRELYFYRKVIRYLSSYHPDIVILFNPFSESASFVEEIKSHCKVVAAIFSDSPLYYKKYEDTNFFQLLENIDIVFSFAKGLIPVFYQLGAKRVEWLPFATDPDFCKPMNIEKSEENIYISDVNHIGNYEYFKEMYMYKLYEKFGNQSKIKIYGYNWDRSENYKLLRDIIFPMEIGNNFGKVCNNSKISLNFVRASHGCYHNMKTFEIPASGGFMITNRTDEQLYFFEEDKEAVYFDTIGELIDKVQFYLTHDYERNKIQKMGFAKAQKITYSLRAEYLIKRMNEV